MTHGFRRPRPGIRTRRYAPLGKALQATGLRSEHLQVASLASIFACVGLWIRAKTVDQSERAHAENRALFVGLWPSTLWLLSDQLAEQD